ncbi:hypothetical protein QLL95_gp0533 [Cotonvirus japonicus]|uniref:Uncharacterized protein n=1 Tax=Cotonvirus japonicus TaxID=2811091 RepID=A0ABM7NTU2_9VIRU|nr:hypothetical protein QLL95_gp0533 [Cotonvirus japonicus]BCS83590.1 hypothetical protein [Cotonvirus japonicus]
MTSSKIISFQVRNYEAFMNHLRNSCQKYYYDFILLSKQENENLYEIVIKFIETQQSSVINDQYINFMEELFNCT